MTVMGSSKEPTLADSQGWALFYLALRLNFGLRSYCRIRSTKIR
jgi:hypothetical protein